MSIKAQLEAAEAAHRPPTIAAKDWLTFDTVAGIATGDVPLLDPTDDDLAAFADGTLDAVDVLERFVAAALGEWAGMLELLDVRRFTLGTHPDGGQTVWLKDVRIQVRTVEQVRARKHADARIEVIRTRGPLKRATADTAPAERTLIVAIADPQIGKGEGGGTLATLDRWDWTIGAVEDRARDLKRLGRPVSRLYAPGMGDTTEGCGGNPNYGQQDFSVDLNEADQMYVAEDMLDAAIDRWAKRFDEVWTTTVSSNHDAKRLGKAYPTGRDDCRAFTIWRSLRRAYSKNPDRYGHVKVWLPEDPDTAVVDLHGVGVAAIHGDLARAGASPAVKMAKWWQGQAFGNQPAGRADVLITAHFHHYWADTLGGRLAAPDEHSDQTRLIQRQLFGCPALDGGSDWFTSSTGNWSAPGVLTMVVDANGVSDVEVLTPPAELMLPTDAVRRTAA